jgi:hypothetical protein
MEKSKKLFIDGYIDRFPHLDFMEDKFNMGLIDFREIGRILKHFHRRAEQYELPNCNSF